MKEFRFIIICLPTLVLSLRLGYAEQKLLAPFKVTGTNQTSVALAVPKETTEDQLGDLVTAISCARKNGKLDDLGVPPTTPRGNKGPSAIISVYIFNDPAWATSERMHQWLESDDGSSFSRQFGQKVQAHYHYSVLGDQEQLSIGFASGGRPFTRSYRLLAAPTAELCAANKYAPAWTNEPDELKSFLDSTFAKNFRIHETDQWGLRSGGQNISFKSEVLPTLSLSVVQSQKTINSFSAVFFVGYALDEPEWKVIKELTETVMPTELAEKALAFAKANMEKSFKEKLSSDNPPTMLRDSYYTMKLKGFVIRAGKHGQEPTFIIERLPKF